MKGVLASYRWRRRFAWLTVTALVVAGVVAAAIVWPGTAEKVQPPSNVPAHINYAPPKAVHLGRHDTAMALEVVKKFVYTAVARKNIDRSWDLAAPELRQGFTRKQWDSGTNPVVGYPVGDARWKPLYSDVQGVGYSIALFPTKGSHEQAQVFLIGLHQLGSGKQRHWVVDNWQAAPTSGSQTVGGGGGSGSVLAQVSPKLSPLGKSKESAVWLLVPAGLLSLIILVPLGIGSVNWYRGRRAERAMLRA